MQGLQWLINRSLLFVSEKTQRSNCPFPATIKCTFLSILEKYMVLKNRYFMRKSMLILVGLLCLKFVDVSGQSVDSIRQVAWSGNYAEARNLCFEHEDYPENTDLLFLVGQTYYWEENLRRSKEVMNDVLDKNPSHIEAYVVLSSILISEKEMSQAIKIADEGLERADNNEELLYNRALANANLGYLKEAREELDVLLSNNPEHKEAEELRESLRGFKIPGSLGVYQSLQTYNKPYDRFYWVTTVEAPVGDKGLKIIPRFSYGNLQVEDDSFNGSQVGVDVYPLTGLYSYMYLHYAYSGAEIFPEHRAALEWFQTIARGWEFSAGGRYMYRQKNHLFYTASVSKYAGKWMPGIRFFYAPESGNNLTAIASVRKYFNSDNTFLHSFITYGSNPDRMDQQADIAADGEASRIAAGAYAVLKMRGAFYARVLAEYTMEEYIPEKWRNVFLGQIGIEIKF